MATVLEEHSTKDMHAVMRFLWAKGLGAKGIHKEMFPVYGGKCLKCEVVHNCVSNVSLMTKGFKWRCRSG
jgi:hypothetical protein